MAAIVRFLNNSSLLVALAAASLTAETFIISSTPIQLWSVLEAFFLTWAAYLFLRRDTEIPYRKTLIYTATTGSVLCLFLTDFFGWEIVLCALLIVLFYNLSLKNLRKYIRYIPRELPLIKPVAVGLAWAVITSVLPALIAFYEAKIPHTMMIYSNFFFITALAIGDDIRDMGRDKNSIKTLPIIMGLNWAKGIAVAFLIIASVIFYSISIHHPDNISAGFYLMMILAAGVILSLHPKKNWHLQALLIDGIICCRFLVLLLVSV